MARTKMAKMKQTSIGRGMARGLPRATFPRRRLQPMTFVRTYVRDRSPPASDTPTKDVEMIEENPAPPPTVGGTKPNNGPLPQPSFGNLLQKLEQLRSDTHRQMEEWECKMAELRTTHYALIDRVGREANNIFKGLREIILHQEAKDLAAWRQARLDKLNKRILVCVHGPPFFFQG